MLSFLKKIFGSEPEADFSQLLSNGAVILDVRTKEEFNTGHVAGSVNIPLQALRGQTSKLNKKKPIITCCQSGVRSASAKSILQVQGFEVYNGKSWTSLRKHVK